MKNTEIRSLELSLKLIKGFDTYNFYRAVSTSLQSSQVSSEISRTVLDELQKAMTIEISKIKEATEWIESVISDNK